MKAVPGGAVRGATTGRCPATRMMRLPAAGAGIAKFERDEKSYLQYPPKPRKLFRQIAYPSARRALSGGDRR